MSDIGRRMRAIVEGDIAGAGDRDPADRYVVEVGARRPRPVRFHDFQDPEPVPRDTDHANVLRSDRPIIVQQSRPDSRQAENALTTAIAYRDARPGHPNPALTRDGNRSRGRVLSVVGRVGFVPYGRTR